MEIFWIMALDLDIRNAEEILKPATHIQHRDHKPRTTNKCDQGLLQSLPCFINLTRSVDDANVYQRVAPWCTYWQRSTFRGGRRGRSAW
jgi:hypothetical protein